MRNRKIWTLEFNTAPVVLSDGSTENREDLRFRIGVEAVYSMHNLQGVPTETIPHYYVNCYVSLHPKPDAIKIKTAKPFCKRNSLC
eukprot:5560221-Amphidinium_carterae.2